MLTIEQMKAIAQADAMGSDYFVVDDKVYDGVYDDAVEQYNRWREYNNEAGKWRDGLVDFLDQMYVEIEYNYDGDYLVFTDDEADLYAYENVKQTLWAFNPDFLAGETGLPVEVFQALADSYRCEGNNDAIEKMIDATCGLYSFVQAAISVDGRGHFMNSYDGDESEFNCFSYTGKNEHLYVVRMN